MRVPENRTAGAETAFIVVLVAAPAFEVVQRSQLFCLDLGQVVAK